MARKQIVELIDDLDGSDATRTIRFGYSGTAYSIDLNDKNAGKLDKVIATYVAAARKDGAQAKRHAVMSGGGSRDDYDPAAVRAWAKERGIPVNDRGRVSADVVNQWRNAS